MRNARGRTRPEGIVHKADRARTTWSERRAAEAARFGREDQPEVLVIGAGQGGIALGARLKSLGVPTLIVEKNPRAGDSWRNRYRSLVLHDPVWYDHLPYLPFPETWPVFCPKDKMGDWLEAYASIFELDIWTSTACERATWDDRRGPLDRHRPARRRGGGDRHPPPARLLHGRLRAAERDPLQGEGGLRGHPPPLGRLRLGRALQGQARRGDRRGKLRARRGRGPLGGGGGGDDAPAPPLHRGAVGDADGARLRHLLRGRRRKRPHHRDGRHAVRRHALRGSSRASSGASTRRSAPATRPSTTASARRASPSTSARTTPG